MKTNKIFYQLQLNGEDMGTFDNEPDAYREKAALEIQGIYVDVIEF